MKVNLTHLRMESENANDYKANFIQELNYKQQMRNFRSFCLVV